MGAGAQMREFSSALKEEASGIWVSEARAESLSYPSKGNDSAFRVEDHSFWFKHRNRCILELIKRQEIPGPVLDIGGGNGYVCRGLEEEGIETILLEPGPAG